MSVVVEFLTGLSRSQRVLRLVVLLAPLVAVLATGPAGQWPPPWVVVVVLAAATAFAVRPETPAGVAALALPLLWWSFDAPDPLGPEALVAGTALLAAHLAAVLASYAPGDAPLDPALLRLWLRRGAGVLLTLPVVWVLARGLDGQPERAGVWAVGVVAALVATVLAAVALTWGEEG